MKIRVLIERERREKTIKLKAGRVGNLLEALGINPEAVIVARGRDLLAGCRPLRVGDRVRVIHIKASD